MDDSARCPVCACEVSYAAGRCQSCGTPHHADCWRYNRGCGIFACRGHRRVGTSLEAPDPTELHARVQALLVALGATFLLLVEPLAKRLGACFW